jgi:4-carboxymuconolactone decarboxylase
MECTMPRLPELNTRDTIPADAEAAFDAIAASRRRVGGPFAVMLHSPEVAARAAHLGSYIRFESTLPAAVRELATIVAAHECECAYEWAAHERAAREAGVPDAVIEAVAQDAQIDGLDDEHALVIRYGRGILTRHRVDDATFEAARARYGERGVIDLTATFGYYSLLACTLNACAVEPSGGGG